MRATAVADDLVFDRIEIRPDARQVLVDGRPATVGARAFDLLVALAERRDRVVSKNELLALVWPGLVVEENNLQVHVSSLRKLLGPEAITTVPGRGYRWTATRRASPDGVPAQAAAPAPATAVPAPPAPGTDPAPAPTLYGRAADLETLRALQGRHRLVSLVGTGGLGKTRLAQAAALEAGADFVHGAWVVELAALTQGAQLPGAVARTLGLPWPGQGTAAGLAERLAGQRALIVLDNAEHLVDDVAALAQALLQGAPALSLLVTSQVPLRLRDERVLRLAPLAFDRPDDGAVALFCARARALQPWFAPDARQLADIRAVCEALDGIPLAIELAAARVPLLGVDGLRQRLGQRFRLLTSGPRNAPARQKTLHAALSWSHGLLSGPEQRLFRQLGVFVGGFGLDLAVGALVAAGDDEWAWLDLLGALVDKSLVIVDAGVRPRYRLLESGRAFALEQLARTDEESLIMQRMVQALAGALGQAADHHEQGLPDDEAIERWSPEIDNLRAALAWADAQGDAALLVALASASAWLWRPAGLPAEGLAWVQRALDRTTADTPPAQRARLLWLYAIGSRQSDASSELAALEEAERLYRQIGDLKGCFRVLADWSAKLVWRHDLAGATRLADTAAALWDPSWPPPMRAGLLSARTYILEVSGRPEAGQPLMEELVALMRAHGSRRRLDGALTELAESLFVQGKAAEAVAIRREVVRRMDEHRVAFAGMNLGNLSAALTYLGEVDEALDVARRAVPWLRLEGRLGGTLEHLALLACRRGRFEAGARALGCADALCEGTGFERELSEQRAHDMALAALRAALDADRLARLRAEGARASVEDAVAWVLD